jgi:hypothetical protein
MSSDALPDPTEQKISLSLDADRQWATLTVGDEAMRLNAHGVATIILELSKVRQDMQPSVADALHEGDRIPVLHSPQWACATEMMHGSSRVYVRHPGLGWLAFLLHASEAEKLGETLLSQAQQEQARPRLLN